MKDETTDYEEIQTGEEAMLARDLSYPGALALNVQKYLPYLDEFEMSEEKKVEFLQTLWSIMTAFVDLGWGVDSIQNFIPAMKEISSEAESNEVEKRIQPCASEFVSVAGADQVKGKSS